MLVLSITEYTHSNDEASALVSCRINRIYKLHNKIRIPKLLHPPPAVYRCFMSRVSARSIATVTSGAGSLGADAALALGEGEARPFTSGLGGGLASTSMVVGLDVAEERRRRLLSDALFNSAFRLVFNC